MPSPGSSLLRAPGSKMMQAPYDAQQPTGTPRRRISSLMHPAGTCHYGGLDTACSVLRLTTMSAALTRAQKLVAR